jgi:hypothetical protein
MLVLLTAAAVGMSRNSLREVMIVGSSRQYAQVKNDADAGLEFSMVWLNPQHTTSSQAQATSFLNVYQPLVQSSKTISDYTNWGHYFQVTDTPDMVISTSGQPIQRYSLKLLFCGTVPPLNTSPTSGGAVTSSQINKGSGTDLPVFFIRSTGYLTIGSGTTSQTFQHTRELWTTVPRPNA